MIVARSLKRPRNPERVACWFADGSRTDENVLLATATLNTSLKKVVTVLRSEPLIYVDLVSDRCALENTGGDTLARGLNWKGWHRTRLRMWERVSSPA